MTTLNLHTLLYQNVTNTAEENPENYEPVSGVTQFCIRQKTHENKKVTL